MDLLYIDLGEKVNKKLKIRVHFLGVCCDDFMSIEGNLVQLFNVAATWLFTFHFLIKSDENISHRHFISHCPKLKVNSKNSSKRQFHFPGMLETVLKLKKCCCFSLTQYWFHLIFFSDALHWVRVCLILKCYLFPDRFLANPWLFHHWRITL